MTTFVIITAILFLAYLFKTSRSAFFYQNDDILIKKRYLLEHVLQDRGVDSSSIFLEAYNFFRNYPSLFDGATIVADYDTIRGLDAPAMVHDWRYLMLQNKGFWYYLIGKLKADWEYGNNMRKLGSTWFNAWVRVFGLILSTPLWMAWVWVNGKTKIKK